MVRLGPSQQSLIVQHVQRGAGHHLGHVHHALMCCRQLALRCQLPRMPRRADRVDRPARLHRRHCPADVAHITIESGATFVRGNGVTLSLSGDDDATLRRWFAALAEGGTVTMPLDKQMWGDVFGMCTDRFGVDWMVNITGG